MADSRIVELATALVARGKGLLAIDESIGTCNERLAAAGIAQNTETRRAYRELLITTPGLGDCVGGVILSDETLSQATADRIPFTRILADNGIFPGIKVDLGAKTLALHPGETVTEGLDGLRERLSKYARLGALFAKWRATVSLGERRPSDGCIAVNAHGLACYAALCQEAGLVPMVEPEVLMTGSHSLQDCAEVTGRVLRCTFEALKTQGVTLEAVILKPNMVLPGLDADKQDTPDEIAEATVNCLLRHVPAAVAGIAFLSGGQTGEQASARLNAINLRRLSTGAHVPWPLVFSFARAIQQPGLRIWGGENKNRALAQQAIYHRASCNSAAIRGAYEATMETRQA